MSHPTPELNADQTEFLAACKRELDDGNFRRVVFTGASKGSDKFRARFELVQGGKKKLVSFSTNRGDSEQFNAAESDTLIAKMKSEAVAPFRAAVLSTVSHDLHYAENRKGESRVYRAKASFKEEVKTHNRQKKYALDQKRPYLKGLGVTSPKGEVIKKQYGKFRQIANFVEIIDRDIGGFVAQADEPISIMDLGCGKGYLTFATYDYVRSRAKHEPEAIGIDIKTDVINLCNNLSDRLGFDGLTFKNARIDKDKPENIDILVALHACDTATDDALALGVRSKMKYLFCAPCCQAEIAAQTTGSQDAFETINNFNLMKRRQADIVTDVSRALLLTSLGYRVKFLEFTALEHTSKNVMLAGAFDPSVDRGKARHEYNELKKSYGFDHHSLEQNLLDLIEL